MKGMRVNWLIVLMGLFFCNTYSQDKSDGFNNDIRRIKIELKSGNKDAFNELIKYTEDKTEITEFLGYHILKNTISNIAWRTIEEYLMLSSDELKKYIKNKTLLKKDLVKNFAALSFVPIAEAYTWKQLYTIPTNIQFIASPSEVDINSVKLLEEYKNELKSDVNSYATANDEEILDKIAKLGTPEAEQFIKSCFTKEIVSEYEVIDTLVFYRSALLALRHFPSVANARFAVELGISGKVDEMVAIECAEKISCIPFFASILDTTKYSQTALEYINYFKSTEEMRIFGYERIYEIKRTDYESVVEFYANVAAQAMMNGDNIIYSNVIEDMVATHNPECLKYLAALLYRQRIKWDEYYFNRDVDAPNDIIKKNTGFTLLMENGENNFTPELISSYSRMSYFVYWNNNYKDFSWNNELKQFVNPKIKVQAASNALSTFRQLNSNSKVKAHEAFLKLTELEPTEINSLMNSDPELLDNADDKNGEVFPTFFEKRLLNMAELVTFCKINNVVYKPSTSLETKLDLLKESTSDAERYKLENDLIAELSINDLTPIEYWCSVSPEDATYSIGRILDKMYSKHIGMIIGDNLQLRLFLKKSQVFDRFGIIGVCNKYLWKLDSYKDEMNEQLKKIQKTENDKDVLDAIKNLQKNNYWKSVCSGSERFPNKDIKDSDEIIKRVMSSDTKQRENMYFELQANVTFMDQVSSGQVDAKGLKVISDSLHCYAIRNKDEDYIYNSAEPFSIWLMIATLPLNEQIKKAAQITNQKLREELLSDIILQCRYKDIPTMVNAYNDPIFKNDNWFIQSHMSNDLGIPVSLKNKAETKILLERFNSLSEIDLYKAYFVDFGLAKCFDASNKPNYDEFYEVLEYDVVDGFVGGGGGRESTVASLVVRYMELDRKTLLGFHWRMEYIQEGYVHSFYERSCAWMKYIRDNNLLTKPLPKVKSFSN
jgi:hypothetical protein